MTEKPRNLRQKFCEVIADLGDIKPDGWNDFHRYKYFSDEQLSAAFRPRLAAAGILIVPYVESCDIRDFQTDKGKHSFLTTMGVLWQIYDADSDEQLTAKTFGQGDDPGDKGANKAMTAAFKYLLIKMAQIGGEGDAEADVQTDKRHAETPTAESVKRKPAKVETPKNKVEGVQKGGRQAGANETQVDMVSRLAKEIGIGFDGLVNVIRNTLSVEVEMPESDADKKKMMRAFMENLTSEEIGQVVQALQTAKERAK